MSDTKDILTLMLDTFDSEDRRRFLEKSNPVNIANSIANQFASYQSSYQKKDITTTKAFGSGTITQKSYAVSTNADFSYGNIENQGVPILPYVYIGGSLQSFPYLNISTVARFKSMYYQVVPLRNAIDSISNVISRIELKLKQKTKNGFTDYNLYNSKNSYLTNVSELLQKPNFFEQKNYNEFILALSAELHIMANAFVIKEYPAGITIDTILKCEDIEIKTLRVANSAEVIQGGQKTIGTTTVPVWRETRYASSANTSIAFDTIEFDMLGNLRMLGTIEVLDRQNKRTEKHYEICHINASQGNAMVGFSKILTCFEFIQIHYLASLFISSSFKNGAAPAAIVQIVSRDAQGGTISERDQQNITSLLKSEIQGATNAGKLISWGNPNYELIYTPIAPYLKDVNFTEIMDFVESKIYTIFHISNSLRQRSGDKYNILQEEIRFYKEGVLPMCSIIETALNSMFFKTNRAYYKNEVFFKFNDVSIEEFREKKLADAKTMTEIGCFTIDEIREFLDRETLKNGMGDKLLTPSNLVPQNEDLNIDL